MGIRELTDKYLDSGLSYRDAQNLAAEEIILSKIASPLRNFQKTMTTKNDVMKTPPKKIGVSLCHCHF